jgi:hypothetical protein
MEIFMQHCADEGAVSILVLCSSGHAIATSRKVAGSIPDEVIGFFN